MRKRKKYRPHRKYRYKKSSYDRYVNNLLRKNKEKLKSLGRNPNYLPKRTSGEWFVASTLKRMKKRYIPEYVIEDLKNDTKKYRIADFYLPKDGIIIEHCGRWLTDKRRYNHKRWVYLKNSKYKKYIFVYPQNLNNLDLFLKEQITKVNEKGRGWHPELDSAKKEIIRSDVSEDLQRSISLAQQTSGKYFLNLHPIGWILVLIVLGIFILALLT